MSTRARKGELSRRILMAFSLIAALSARAAGQQGGSTHPSPPNADGSGLVPAAAKGEVVPELGRSIFYVLQARNGDYWFGSDDRGVYRYDGKALVHFTMKDGLVSDSIRGMQEGDAGRLYFTTYAGIIEFDGRTFTTLRVSTDSAETDWKLNDGELWFVDAPDTGAVFRFDGELLHRLKFPSIKAGDDHIAKHPRSEFPNAKYSPYDVYTIVKDREGCLWFGTALLGACRFDGSAFAWIPDSDLRSGSFGTRSIAEDKDGSFWFSNALHRYEVDRSDPNGPRFRKEVGIRDPRNPDRARFGGIMSTTMDGAGALWIATYGEGVWRYDGKTATHYPVTADGKAITLFTISKDNGGVLWLGTHREGAYRFNGSAFEKFRP